MMRATRLASSLAVLLALTALTPNLRAQGLEPQVMISEIQAREWATIAASKAAGNPKAFDQAFQNLARVAFPSYHADPSSPGVTVYRSNDLIVTAAGPASMFEVLASEAVQKKQSIDRVPWPCGATVIVTVLQLSSPDIEKIVVKRDGQVVPPLHNGLGETALTTRPGQTVVLHQGTVCYPVWAFAPGANVSVTAVPAGGENLVKTLMEESLKVIL